MTDAEIDKRVEQVKKQYFEGDQKKLAAELKKQGYTNDAFRDDVRSQLVSEAIYEESRRA